MSPKAPKQSAGYQRGVVLGDGSTFGRPRDFDAAKPWTPPPDSEPRDERERLGRLAFYASRARLLDFFPAHPTWAQMTPIQQEAWCDAAEAVRAEVTRSAVPSECGPQDASV